jgi:hypothetical protein
MISACSAAARASTSCSLLPREVQYARGVSRRVRAGVVRFRRCTVGRFRRRAGGLGKLGSDVRRAAPWLQLLAPSDSTGDLDDRNRRTVFRFCSFRPDRRLVRWRPCRLAPTARATEFLAGWPLTTLCSWAVRAACGGAGQGQFSLTREGSLGRAHLQALRRAAS